MFRCCHRAVGLSVVALMLGLSAAEQGEPAPDMAFDAVAERADAWQLAPGRVEVVVDREQTRGTASALHMKWNKDLGDLAGQGTHKTSILPFCWAKLPEGLDLSKYTQLTFWAKIEGTRHGHLHVAFSSHPGLWGKGVIRVHNNNPLDAGDWSRYVFAFGQKDAEERKQYRWFGIGSVNVGRQPDEASVMDVWLDDWTLSAKPMRKWKGWDADPTVVTVSQLGFRRFHEKLGVVDGKCKAKDFVVRDAESGAEALKGHLRLVRSAVGTYKVADFTRFTKPGRYVVEVGDLKSLPFSVGDDAYHPCIELLSDWIFNMRCGCRTALHEPCHTDDGILVRYEGKGKSRKELSRRRLDVVGGWHDAGDVRTYYTYTFWLAHQMLRTRECGWRRDRDGDGVDDLMDSAWWGMRHLPKIQHPDEGRFFWKIEDWPDYRRGNYWTDCKADTHDDRHIMDSGESPDSVGRACASAGLFARRALSKHREVAAAALRAAEERWATWFDPDSGNKRWREKPIHVHKHGYHIAKWGQGSLQLHLATKKPAYLELAEVCADHILGYQRRTFYEGGPRPMCGEIFSWLRGLPDRDLPEEYLADLMIELPDHPDYYKWRAALVRAANWWMKPTRHFWRPFSVPHLEVPASSFTEDFFGVPLSASPDQGAKLYLVPTAGGTQLGDTAQGLQRVAQALNDVELERLARWQVHWAVGHNPFNVSWVSRFGQDCIDQYYSFSQGRMPGSVSTGFGIGSRGVPGCVRPGGGESHTTSAARLLRAMVAISAPARLRLTLTNAGVPWQGKAIVRWTVKRDVISVHQTDAQGQLPEMPLDGGQRYDLFCGRAVVPLTLVSGTTYERTIDLSNVLILSADKPKYVVPQRPFTIDLKVANRGLAPAKTRITVHAEDATTEVQARTVEIAPGKSETIPWPFVAGQGNRPYVLFFEPDGDRLNGLDVTGAILP